MNITFIIPIHLVLAPDSTDILLLELMNQRSAGSLRVCRVRQVIESAAGSLPHIIGSEREIPGRQRLSHRPQIIQP